MENDPKPKKPLTTFFRFCNQNREKVKQENPDLKGGPAITKELSNIWNDLNEDEKAAYAPNFKEEMEEYKTKLAEWKKNHEDDEEEETKKRGKSKGKKVARKSEDEHEDEKPKKNQSKKGDHDNKKKIAKEEAEEIVENEDGFKLDKKTNTLIKRHTKRINDVIALVGLALYDDDFDYIDDCEVEPTSSGKNKVRKAKSSGWYNTRSTWYIKDLFLTECRNIEKITDDKKLKFARTVAFFSGMLNFKHWMHDNDDEEEQFQEFIDMIWDLAKGVLDDNTGEKVKCLKDWGKKFSDAVDECTYGYKGGCDLNCKFKEL